MAETLYTTTLSAIKASEAFKRDTIARMQDKARDTEAAVTSRPVADTSEPAFASPRRRPSARMLAGLAACLVVVAAAAVFGLPQLRSASGGYTSAAPMAPGAPADDAAPKEPAADLAEADGGSAPMAEAAMDAAIGESELELPAAPPTGAADADNSLPLLTVEENWGGMGFEGYMAYSIDELVNGNPWTADADLDTLPVFTNVAPADPAGIPLAGLDADEMLALARQTATALGLEEQSHEIHPTDAEKAAYLAKVGQPMPRGDSVTRVVVVCDGGDITVEPNGEVTGALEPAVALPEGISFTHYDTSYTQAEGTLTWLAETYDSLVDMQQPAQDISGGSRDIYHRQSYRLGLYEGAGTLTEQIVSYHFNHIGFANDDDGLLSGFRRTRTDLSEKLGDYPIITAEAAETLLLAGHYITSVPETMPGAAYVAKAELIYRTGRYEAVFMPYYRFYVEVPALARDNGLKTYGAYYVPAVSGEYIANMPLWDGSFN